MHLLKDRYGLLLWVSRVLLPCKGMTLSISNLLSAVAVQAETVAVQSLSGQVLAKMKFPWGFPVRYTSVDLAMWDFGGFFQIWHQWDFSYVKKPTRN